MIRLAVLAVALLFPALTQAQVLLAGHPLTAGLAVALAKGTPLTVEAVVPVAIPMTRQYAYFTGRGEAKLAEVAKRADAVLTLRSAWAEDPLYPLARRVNIRLVEIDAAKPVDGALTGIATRDGAAFPWLGIANGGRMADIVAADLRRLYPAHKEMIDINLAEMKAAVLGLSSKVAGDFAAADDVTVAVLSDRFAVLAADLGLDVARSWVLDDRDWTSEKLAELSARLRVGGIRVVLHHRQPAARIAQAVADGGARLVVLDSLESGVPVAMDQALAVMAEQIGAALR